MEFQNTVIVPHSCPLRRVTFEESYTTSVKEYNGGLPSWMRVVTCFRVLRTIRYNVTLRYHPKRAFLSFRLCIICTSRVSTIQLFFPLARPGSLKEFNKTFCHYKCREIQLNIGNNARRMCPFSNLSGYLVAKLRQVLMDKVILCNLNFTTNESVHMRWSNSQPSNHRFEPVPRAVTASS